MSSPLAIGAVSAVLRNLLDNGIVDVGVPIGSVAVTAVAPDIIDLEDANASPSLNVFLYRTSRNIGWENAALPTWNGHGDRVANSPLALDLHLLVTAYGAQDFEAEILLGYAMHILHERPVLDRRAIRRALDPSPLSTSILPPAFQALTASDLADQVESITITQEPMDTEEMSRLWAALQSPYRPTVAYVATVVLIEARRPTADGLPVLTRGVGDPATGRDRGVVVAPDLIPPLPTIETIVPPDGNPAAALGDLVRMHGHHLDGSAVVARFAHRLLDTPNTVGIGVNSRSNRIDVTLPSGATAEEQWPAGVYTVTLELLRPGETISRVTNAAALLLAPTPVLPPGTITRDAGTGRLSVDLGVAPQIRPGQDARLTLGTTTGAAQPSVAPSSVAHFVLPPVPAGPQWLRLTVDGVESLVVDRTTTPPSFDPARSVMVPA